LLKGEGMSLLPTAKFFAQFDLVSWTREPNRLRRDTLRTFLLFTTIFADPGCLSRILIFTHPYPRSRIPEPKTATKERGDKIVVLPFLYPSISLN
jgi:hypothetical protein